MQDFDSLENSIRVAVPGKVRTGCKELLYPLAIALIAALCFLPGLGSFGPLDPTDSFFIEAAREMIERNHYLTGLYNYTDWLDKPILAFLPIITSIKLFGMSDWAARLPAALSGMGLIITTYFFTAPILGKRTALLCAIILSSSPIFLLTGHVALSDEPLSLFFGIAMFYAASALASKNSKINILAYVFLALAILTKGPIALILALIATSFYVALTCPSWSKALFKLRQVRPLAGIVIVLAICLPYFCLAHATTHGAFTTQFFLRQNLGRMLGTVNHQEPLWFYLPIVFGGYFPWIFYLLISVTWLRKIFSIRKQLTTRQSWLMFCCCWLFSVLALFTLVPTKLPTYIVPLSPALAILVASYLTALIRSNRLNNMTLVRSLFLSIPMALIFVAAGICLWFLPAVIKQLSSTISEFAPTLHDGRLMLVPLFSPELFGMSCFLSLVATGALAAISVWSFLHKQVTKAILSLSLASILACAVLIPCGYLWAYQTRQVSINNLIHMANLRNGSLAILFSRIPSAVFYTGKSVAELQSLSELEQFCRSGAKPHLLLATQNCLNLPELKAKQHLIVERGKWFLLNVEGYPW